MRLRRVAAGTVRIAVAGATFGIPLAALAGLLRMDGPRMDLPDSPTPAGVGSWWADRPTLDAVAALGRWVAVIALAAVLASSTLAAAHHLRPGRASLRLMGWVPRPLRLALTSAFAVALTAAPVGASTDGGAVDAPRSGTTDVPTMWVEENAASVTTAGTAPPGSTDRGPVPSSIAPEATTTPPSTTPPTTPPIATPPTTTPPTSGGERPAAARAGGQASTVVPGDGTLNEEVVVRPGDHLWGIAQEAVARHLGRPAGEAEVATYWRDLIAANLDRLVDPTNADLILPGQVLRLPPPSA